MGAGRQHTPVPALCRNRTMWCTTRCQRPRSPAQRRRDRRNDLRRLTDDHRSRAQHAGAYEDQGNELHPRRFSSDPALPVYVTDALVYEVPQKN